MIAEGIEKAYQVPEVCAAGNFSASLFLLGSQVLCTHYGGIMDCPVGGQVPATIAFGEVGLGKPQCAEATQSMMGLTSQYRPSKITDAQATKFATQTTLGFVIDDQVR